MWQLAPRLDNAALKHSKELSLAVIMGMSTKCVTGHTLVLKVMMPLLHFVPIQLFSFVSHKNSELKLVALLYKFVPSNSFSSHLETVVYYIKSRSLICVCVCVYTKISNLPSFEFHLSQLFLFLAGD